MLKTYTFLAALLVTTGWLTPPKRARYFVSNYENVLGTSLELKVFTNAKPAADKAEAAVLHEIARLSAILSGYDANSEFRRWLQTHGTPEKVSPELFEVLGLFDEWRRRTEGALDPAAEVVTSLWKAAARRGELPSAAELAAAVARVREPHWRLDSVNHTAMHLSDAPLMLNSFTKSYIIRHAADAGRAAGNLDGIVVNIGGDLVISGTVTETVLVSNPRDDAENASPIDRLAVTNRAVATSGNYRRGESIGGHWYSHIVDPRTGQPAGGILSATVIAPSATDAGALATAFNVLTPAESAALAAQVPGVEYLIITASGERIASRGWAKLEITSGGVGGDVAAEDFEAVISLQINTQNAGNVKRPYIAVWIEDEQHAPVRTIAIWHGGDRYLPELKSWYLKNRDRYTANRDFSGSATGATRPAGKYTVKWDGKDDEGKAVAQGKYILKIEATREHGTYQLMRQEFNWNEQPQQFDLGSNIEVAASMVCKKSDHGN